MRAAPLACECCQPASPSSLPAALRCYILVFPSGLILHLGPLALPACQPAGLPDSNFRELDPTIPNGYDGIHPDPRLPTTVPQINGARCVDFHHFAPARCCPSARLPTCTAVTSAVAELAHAAIQQALGLDAGVIIARDLDTPPTAGCCRAHGCPMTEVLCALGALLALRRSCPPTPHGEGEFRPLSVTLDRRSECRIGLRDARDRAVLGWAGLGWAGTGGTPLGHWGKTWGGQAPCPPCHHSKQSIGLALFDPDHRAVSCTPSRTRPRTASQGLDAARLLLLQTGQSCPMGDRPALSAQPLPPKHMSCAALCAASLLRGPHASTPCFPNGSILVASSSLWL